MMPLINQVAINGFDTRALREWYRQCFGLEMAGTFYFFPPATSRVQGIPGAREVVRWLVDRQDYFQLELFRFTNPRSRVRPADWRPCDLGSNMPGIAVDDFDAVRARAGPRGVQVGEIVGPAGDRSRMVWAAYGNWRHRWVPACAKR